MKIPKFSVKKRTLSVIYILGILFTTNNGKQKYIVKQIFFRKNGMKCITRFIDRCNVYEILLKQNLYIKGVKETLAFCQSVNDKLLLT